MVDVSEGDNNALVALSLMRIEHRLVRQGPKALLTLALTAREAEVLFWITEGKTNPEIAIILDTSPGTVKKYGWSGAPRIQAVVVHESLLHLHWLAESQTAKRTGGHGPEHYADLLARIQSPL